MSLNKKWTLEQTLPWLLLIGGALGLLASFILTIEKFDALQNPNYSAVCDLNPVLSCSSVTASAQAAAFGFPNPFLGIAGYAVLATVGAALLAGAQFKRWFWRLSNLGLLFAMGFVTWLQYQSLYKIGALCIFCMVVWSVTAPMFWYTTLYNLRKGHLGLPARLDKAVAFAQRHHADILLSWYVIIIALIIKRFWYYWSTLV